MEFRAEHGGCGQAGQNIQNFSMFLGIIWAEIIGFSAALSVF